MDCPRPTGFDQLGWLKLLDGTMLKHQCSMFQFTDIHKVLLQLLTHSCGKDATQFQGISFFNECFSHSYLQCPTEFHLIKIIKSTKILLDRQTFLL